MIPTIAEAVARLDPVTLDQLNIKAPMLERRDNKYILPAEDLAIALGAFAPHFDALEIDGKRAFAYDTLYFDDPDLHGYYDHHQGRRKRCKVRVRDYVDAGMSYLEVKLKDLRGLTIKKRLKLTRPLPAIDEEAMRFIDRCHHELYGEPLARPLAAKLGVSYERLTLVAKSGSERMTIDTALNFSALGFHRNVAPTMCIIETKSARGHGEADSVLRKMHLHPTQRCSKYCVGMAAMGCVARQNKFLPALRRLGFAGSGDWPAFA